MAWRDRLRRRAAAPDVAVPGSPGATGTPGPSTGGGSGPSTGGAPGSAVPGDWDGGWRRTVAPELTVSRAPLGVSDGLAFRAGLAAWQNPSFDAGLGHALLPTAPTGLVSGVTRPAAAPRHTHSAGGPLLLRALRPEGADGPGESEGTARRQPRSHAGPVRAHGHPARHPSRGHPVRHPWGSAPATTALRGRPVRATPGGPAASRPRTRPPCSPRRLPLPDESGGRTPARS
jgi:syndecan 1